MRRAGILEERDEAFWSLLYVCNDTPPQLNEKACIIMYDHRSMLKFVDSEWWYQQLPYVEVTLVTSGRAVSEHLDLTGSGLL